MNSKQAIVDEFSAEFASGTKTLTQLIIEFLKRLREKKEQKRLRAELEYIQALKVALDARERVLKHKESKQGEKGSAQKTRSETLQQKQGAHDDGSVSIPRRSLHQGRQKRGNPRLQEQKGHTI